MTAVARQMVRGALLARWHEPTGLEPAGVRRVREGDNPGRAAAKPGEADAFEAAAASLAGFRVDPVAA